MTRRLVMCGTRMRGQLPVVRVDARALLEARELLEDERDEAERIRAEWDGDRGELR